jgi:hypothetical protein
MRDFLKLAAAIASQLDGVLAPSGEEWDSAPSGDDIAWINLQNEREGLRVHVRRGYGAEKSRLRATIGFTGAERGRMTDYRELPSGLHQLETAAALSREARAIAAQIETKIIQPAIPLLEEWRGKKARLADEREQLESAVARYRERFPTARIDLGEKETYSANFYGASMGASGGYVNGRINRDGSFYIDRMSSIGESAAFALLDSLNRK